MLDYTKSVCYIIFTVFCIVLTGISSTVYGTDYHVSVSGSDGGDGSPARPWRSIAKAAAAVPAGAHTILVGAGTYEETVVELKPGVSLKGAGAAQTIIRNGSFVWYQGAIKLHSPQATAGNQSVSGLSLEGKAYNCYVGIQVQNRSNIKIFDVRITQFYHAGIELTADYGLVNQNIEIYNFDIRESARESGAGSFGNITSRGKIVNLQVHDGVIYHLSNVAIGTYGEKTSGYAIKCLAVWGNGDFSHDDFVTRSKFYNIKEYGKAYAPWGANVPNISFEFWHIGGEQVEIYNCEFTTHLSLEWDGTPRGPYSFWVHDNRFAVEMGQSMELTTSNAIIENNVFDYRENTNAWNVIGEYNQKSRGGSNIHIRRNYFLLGDRSPILWALGNPTQDLFFYNNTISGTGSPALFQVRSTSNNVASRNLQVFNNAFDLGGSGSIAAVSYEGGTAQPQGMVLAHNHHGKAFSALPAGASQSNNRQVMPALLRSGALALPYLSTGSGSELIDAGRGSLPAAPLPMGYSGNGPDIGAYESGQAAPVPVNQNPAVSLTAPASNAAYPAGSSVSVSASATDSDGSIAKVEFFAGTVKIGEKTTAPYTVGWGNVAAGSYQLTAKATDDKGGTATSAPITITVSTQNQMPTVSLAVSAGSVTQNSVVTISASAADADGQVAKVEFFAGTTKIGEKTAAPFSIDWTAATAGTVALTAKVTDNQGGVTTSTSVNLNVTAIPVNQAPSVSLTAPTNNAKLTEGDKVTLTATAADSDGLIAKVEFFAGTTKIGEKTAAPFTMDWNNLAVGTFALTARATDDKGVMTTSSAVTVLVEAKVIPNQNPVISIVAPAANATFTEGDNLTVTVDAKDSDGSIAKVEYFAGTTKLGESTTLPFSFNWTNLKVGSYSVTAKATDDKGAAVTSSAIAITVVAKVVPNQAPLVSVTGPTNNATSEEGDVITITAAASDADGSVSKVEFFANSIKIGEKTNAPFTITWTGAAAGTYSLTAKATDEKGAEKTSTAVAVTVTKKLVTDTTANENPVVALTEPIANSTFTEGETVKLTATASDADGSVAKVEFYAENVKIGEATTAPYTINWNNVAKGTYSITAKATDNQNGTAVSTASSITVTAKPNQNPSIAISSPAGNASFTEGESVTISVNASDSDGSIAKVEFFAGTTKIGETTTAPFAFNWTNLATGTYSLTAKATDNQNGSVTSAAVSVTVKAKPAPVPAPNSAPVVSLTAPTANASFTEGDNITLTATAADSDGLIAKVEFFAGTTKIGEKTAAPFTMDWNAVATGNYSLTAKATDDKGLATTSAAVAVVVKAKVAPVPAPTPNSAPVVSLTAPANNAKYTEGATITLTASASDADGSVSKVEFFNGTTKLGEKTASPFAMEWTSVTMGTYTLTAKATDNQGTSSTSASITVVVEAKPVAPRPAPNQLPTIALTSPASGASFTEGNTVTITASASDADGSVSKVEFFANSIKIGEKTNAPFTITWNAVAGSQSITAKVTDNANAVATSAAVAVTVNAVPAPPVENKLPVVAISSPAVNARFTEGNTVSITASATDSDGSIAKVEFFAGATKIGEAAAAPYTVSWTKVAQGNYALTAVATDNKGGKTTSAAVSIAVVAAPVVVTPAPPTANQVPTVRLSSPTANGTYTTAQTVPLVADAKDADGQVAKVEFFANESKIGEKTAAPYSMSTTLKAGSYSLTAVATDNKGSSATSAAITINVTQPVANNPQTAPAPNKAPVVSITAPVTNAKYTEGTNATLTASATDSDGSISKVEFFAGTTKIGEKTAAPFTVDWTNLAVGTYAVTAKATDNKNAATTSAAITIIVEAKPVVVPPAPPAPTPAPAPVTPPAPVATTPTFFRAINLNGPSMEIDGNKWGGSDAANYTYSGTSMNKPTVTLNPTTDKNRTAMIQSAITGRNVTLAMTSVPNATYDVYLYVWEDDAAQTYSVYLEGKAVQVNYTSGAAGTWKRLGPFRQTIADKNINITTSGGAANVSGIEVWQVPAQQALTTNCSATGNILHEAWQNVAADMSTMIPAYKKPDNSTQLTVFEAPTNVGDNYSSRIRGYICPPATGSYTFWISGDAEAELWLGLNEDPATKTKIAYLDGATNPREWNKSATQQSAPIQLEKGKKYYIEAVHKAGTGNDHLAVGWQMPGGIQEMPLAGVRLSPYVPTEKEFELPALEGGKVALFPNPAAEQTNVRFSVNEDQDAVITVTNLSAQQVVSMTEPVRSGENVVPIAVAGLSKGVYVVTVQVKEGRLSQKLIVTQ